MLKKAVVVGKGTAGSLAYLKLLKLRHTTNSSFDIDWYYDSNTKAMAVGEGTTPNFPLTLSGIRGLGYRHAQAGRPAKARY